MSDRADGRMNLGGARIPLATYRIQLNAGFTCRDAERIVPYLAELGGDTLYASPVFRAQPGSSHGYDVVDGGALNPELGGEAGFGVLAAALGERGMRLLLDFVPNQMGIARGRNPWWQDVLENGPASPHAAFFDVDWRPHIRAPHGKVLLPILGDQYGTVLERGEPRLRLDGGAFAVNYFETPLPITPPTPPPILRHRLDPLIAALPPMIRTGWNCRASSPPSSGFPGRMRTTPRRTRSGSGSRPSPSATWRLCCASRSRSGRRLPRRWTISTGRRAIPPRSTRSTACSPPSRTGSPSGESRRKRSTTAAPSR